ncbi:MAG: hypothetical protein JNK56_10185 [Myxococcales bacterium]|nr:hypothetical protein [Myxococcales bacterium]
MRRGTAWLVVAGLLGGCGDSGDGSAGASASESTGAASTGSSGAPTTSGEATGTGEASSSGTPTTGGSEGLTTGSSGDTSTSTASGTSGGDTSTGAVGSSSSGGGDTSTGAPVNQPPVWDSEPGLAIVLADVYVSNFEPGQIFLASSRTDEIRVHDAETLAFLQAWTHPAFSKVNSTLFTYGPNGMAFNERGNLVVAAYADFVEFSDYGVEYKVYPKMAAEATENIIFDALGNLYTTTSTGGTDKLNQYSAKDYVFKQTIALPPGAGQLTGITFDGSGRLYVASQTGNTIHVSDVNTEFEVFSWVKKLSGAGNPGNFEGLQFNATGELVAAAGDLVRYNVETTNKIGTFDAPNDLFPVPLRVDNSGNIYTSDYENGVGTLPADIFKFNSQGELIAQANDPGLFGPFGLALSGTVLAGDPPVEWTYQLAASDPDGDPLTYTLVMGPPGMVLDANTNILSWLVTSEDIGEYEVTLAVDDGQGGVTQQMFVLVVSAG